MVHRLAAVFRARVRTTAFFGNATAVLVLEARNSECETIQDYGPFTITAARTLTQFLTDNGATWPSGGIYGYCRVVSGTVAVNNGGNPASPASFVSASTTPDANSPEQYTAGDQFVFGEFPL